MGDIKLFDGIRREFVKAAKLTAEDLEKGFDPGGHSWPEKQQNTICLTA
jgi:hypothetical protein